MEKKLKLKINDKMIINLASNPDPMHAIVRGRSRNWGKRGRALGASLIGQFQRFFPILSQTHYLSTTGTSPESVDAICSLKLATG
jgi:hypothetical protein